jgi:two-component system KDP operon response regulator KdpE
VEELLIRDNRNESQPEKPVEAEAAHSDFGRNSWVALLGDFTQQRTQLIAALAEEGLHVMDAADPSSARAPVPGLVLIDAATIDAEGAAQAARFRRLAPAPLFLRLSEDATVDAPATTSGNATEPFEPFGTADLLQRVQKVVHQVQTAAPRPMNFVLDAGDLQCDLGRQAALVDGRAVALSPTQYRLFATFMKNAGNTLTHEQLLLSVWGPTYSGEVDYLRVQVGRLRQKLERYPATPRYFVSAPGVGYRLTIPASDRAARS